MKPFFQTVAILGPGLLGSSVARAIQARNLAGKVSIWARREETREACRRADWCDEVHPTPSAAVSGASLVVLATPVAHILEVMEEMRPGLATGTLVTDVGSTKALICKRAREIFGKGVHFVGAHPMAGSEKTGLENGRADLFERAPCILTPDTGTPPEIVRTLGSFWSALGARLVFLDPGTHDERVAEVSHLPHLVAAALVRAALGGNPGSGALAGPGFRDTTRVAAGSPQLWREIVSQNDKAILRALDAFGEAVGDFRKVIAAGDFDTLEALLVEARDWRSRWTDDTPAP